MTPGQREGLECGDRECTHSPCWEYRQVVEKVIASERRRIRRALKPLLNRLRLKAESSIDATDRAYWHNSAVTLDAATRRQRKR